MGALLLVRHGQASFGAEDYDVLSEHGVEQSAALGSALAAQGVRPRRVIHGSLRRQRDTARAMIETLSGATGSVTSFVVDERWDEFDHLDVVAAYDGQVRGASTRDLDRRAFQEVFERATARWTAGTGAGEYAETFAAFVDRVGAALGEAAASVESGETGIVVTSGGVIAVAVALLTLTSSRSPEMGAVWQRVNTVLANTSVTRVLVGGSGVRLLTFNEHGHLDRAQVTYR